MRKYKKKSFKKKVYNNKRKTFKRRHHGMKPTRVIIRQPSAIPDFLDVKLKYIETGFKTTSTGYYTAIYSGNGAQGPQITGGFGTGHKPMSWNNWISLYGYYMVKASSIKIQFIPSSTTQVVVYPIVNSGTGPSTLGQALEFPRVKTCMCSGANGPTSLRNYMTTATMFGVKSLNNDDQPYCALTSAAPAQQWFWIVGFEDPDLATTTILTCKVEITYYLRFFGRINLVQST
nr:MAG: capsid protein [Cressdnaviricota sp.]